MIVSLYPSNDVLAAFSGTVKRKGAARQVSKKQGKVRALRLSHLITMLIVTVLAALALLLFKSVLMLVNVPVEQVEITGETEHVARESIQAIIEDHAVDGFIGLDLSSLHDAIVALPRVREVTIKRLIPDRLVIAIKEESVLASWNGQGFITTGGHLIRPETSEGLGGLPAFSGVDHQQVLTTYRRIFDMLGDWLGSITALNVDTLGIVTVTFSAGLFLRLQAADLKAQLTRLKTIESTPLYEQLGRIAYMDLRYSKGFAVAFKNDKKTTGYIRGDMMNGE